MLWPKKNSYKVLDDETKFLRLENSPPPPHDFSNGPSLSSVNSPPTSPFNTLLYVNQVPFCFEFCSFRI